MPIPLSEEEALSPPQEQDMGPGYDAASVDGENVLQTLIFGGMDPQVSTN